MGVFAAAAAALFPWLASAEENLFPLGGRVFFDVYAPLRDNGGSRDFRELVTSLWLTGQPKLSERSSARFAFQVDSRDSGVSLQLREGYATFTSGGVELRAGRQIVVWGKSDALNPTDWLSAKDYTVFNPDDEVRRTGTQLVSASYTPDQGNSPWTFSAVWAPLPARSRLLIASSSVPAGISFASGTVAPSGGLSASEIALKAAFQQPSWDLEILAFRGWNHFPDLALQGTTLSQVHRRQSALGLNGSATAGKFVLRVESAYVWTENPDGSNPLIQPTHWDTVLGVERGFGEEWRVQLQGVLRAHPQFQSGDEVFPAGDPRRSIAQANALLLGYQFKERLGATLRLAYTRTVDGLEAELFVLGNFMGGDYLLRPRLSYPVTDALRLTTGLEWYGGPEDRSLGALQAFNSAFGEVKYSF